jgi:hypothetical protein
MVPRPFIRSHNSQVEDFYVFGDGQEGNVTGKKFLAIAMLFAVLSFQSKAQSHTDMAALKGLSPVTMLSNTPTGNAVLGANYVVTGGIQTGAIEQPTLLPFSEQQQQALRDAFITDGNLAQLADGLGTTLGAGYMARAHYIDRQNFTGVSESEATYAVRTVISEPNRTRLQARMRNAQCVLRCVAATAPRCTEPSLVCESRGPTLLDNVHRHRHIFVARSAVQAAVSFKVARLHGREQHIVVLVGFHCCFEVQRLDT